MRLQNKLIILFVSILILTFLTNIFLVIFLIRHSLTRLQQEEMIIAGEMLRNSLEGKIRTFEIFIKQHLVDSSMVKNQMKDLEKKVRFFKEEKILYLKENWSALDNSQPPFPLLLNNPLSKYLKGLLSTPGLEIGEIVITDKDGFPLAFTKIPPSPLLDKEKWWKKTINLGFYSGIVEDKLSFSYPIFDNQKLIGVVRVLADIDGIFKPLKLFSLGKTGTAHFLIGKKLVLSSSNWKGSKLDFFRILEKGDYQKKEWLLRIFPSHPSLEWKLILIKNPQEEEYILTSVIKNVFKQFLISLLIFILIGIYFARYLTTPLKHIEKFANRLAKGRLSYRLRINTGDEIESLAEALNTMAQKLEKAMKALKEEKETIKKVSETKSLFLSAVSHEFKTPLTIITNYAQLLATGKLGEVNEEQKNRLIKISLHSRYLIRLVENLLNLSRLESGEWETQFQEFSLRNFLEEVKQEFSPLAKNKNIQLSLELPARLPRLLSDPYALRLALDNLIENAIKFTPPKGEVIIKAGRTDSKVRIEVEDTGPGIPPEEREKIFEPFYRVDRKEVRKSWGTGLGLSITRELLKILDGEIEVREGKKGGSVFVITLPIKGG
ncbi:sensor histidine kinase [Candidatus Calescamantes bacterium]|nr:sensor histidine kinase [Candidatus Calescamantes bacterium]